MILIIFSLFVLVFLLARWLTSYLCLHPSRLVSLDHPNKRSLHVSPTPKTGGLAILASLSIGLFLILTTTKGQHSFFLEETQIKQGFWILGTTLLIIFVSFLDDQVGIPPSIRFGIHLIAAAGIVWGVQLRLDDITIPSLGTLSLGWMSVPLTIIFILWLTNLYNFMDGMDGFAGGMTILGFGFLGYLFWISGSTVPALLSCLIVLATAGFLHHNIPPAKIFMGDVGSTSLGFFAAIFSLVGIHQKIFDVWIPIIIFSPFIVDATVTLMKRLLSGKKIWEAHREHYYQRLVLAGWGHKKTVLAEYVLILASGFSALIFERASSQHRLGILIGWVAIYAIIAYKICLLEKNKIS